MKLLILFLASITSVMPPKSGGKVGFSSSTPSKIRASVSPLLSTPEKSGFPLSPPRNNNLDKVHTNKDDTSLTQFNKGNASTPGVVQNKPGSNENLGNKPTDLQSLLISLLMEKPHGMNLKVSVRTILDVAVWDGIFINGLISDVFFFF